MILSKLSGDESLRGGVFAPPDMLGELRRRTARSAAITFGKSGIKFLMGIISNRRPCRDSDPEDFGLIAMTAT
jgi:hypothetical protein